MMAAYNGLVDRVYPTLDVLHPSQAECETCTWMPPYAASPLSMRQKGDGGGVWIRCAGNSHSRTTCRRHMPVGESRKQHHDTRLLSASASGEDPP